MGTAAYGWARIGKGVQLKFEDLLKTQGEGGWGEVRLLSGPAKDRRL